MQSILIKSLKTQPFSLATDGSNDSDPKFFPAVGTFFNEESGKNLKNFIR